MKQKCDADKADNHCFEYQVALKCLNRLVNEPGAVVSGDDLDTRRKRWGDFPQLCFHSIDHVQRVHAVAHDDNPTYRFSFALPVNRAATYVGTKGNATQIPD